MNNPQISMRSLGGTDRPAVTRFAPSPTGYLHLGHVANAIYVWGLAGAVGASVHLRIEDHDRVRSRTHFAAALLEDLDWLGFVADSGRTPLHRQSDHPDRYQTALARLRRTHHVYACRCSRKEIGGERYPGYCRALGLPEIAGHGLRVAIEPGVEPFDDLLAGRLEDTPADQCGDLLVRDRDGQWTYQFAVTVDDIADQVSLVVRGRDLITSTGRQIRLARMLGRPQPPRFAHHPLILGADGVKLSKSRRDTGVRELRGAGVTAAAVIGRAAAALGLTEAAVPVEATDVARLFRKRNRVSCFRTT
jgi:glutamyl/glutaminyl-tRNA synthetase